MLYLKCEGGISANIRTSGSTGSSTGIVFAIYNIGSIPAVVLTGPVNDYFGRRAGMFTGAVIIIIGTCIQAPAINMREYTLRFYPAASALMEMIL